MSRCMSSIVIGSNQLICGNFMNVNKICHEYIEIYHKKMKY